MGRKMKRALIYHAEGNPFNNPTMKCLIDLMLERGFSIDLHYLQSTAPMPLYKGIKLFPFRGRLQRWKDKLSVRPLGIFPVFFIGLLQKIINYKRYNLIIGVDRQGLIAASELHKITGIPYIFISFEIMFEEETSAEYKLPEREASKEVAAWIVQDDVRAAQLQRENHLDPLNKILLPVASAGVGIKRESRLRDRLGIPRSWKVAISMGHLDKCSMISQIINSIADWPDDWALIVHARYGHTSAILAEYLSKNANLLNRKIFVSDAATEFVDDMGDILSGVNVGLAFYMPEYEGKYRHFTGNNLKYLGLSSGKISTYLRYDIPVIMNDIGVYAEEARTFKFGCVVNHPVHIKDYLAEISREEYSKNARNYYSEKLDFNIYRHNILSLIDEMAA